VPEVESVEVKMARCRGAQSVDDGEAWYERRRWGEVGVMCDARNRVED